MSFHRWSTICFLFVLLFVLKMHRNTICISPFKSFRPMPMEFYSTWRDLLPRARSSPPENNKNINYSLFSFRTTSLYFFSQFSFSLLNFYSILKFLSVSMADKPEIKSLNHFLLSTSKRRARRAGWNNHQQERLSSKDCVCQRIEQTRITGND